MQARRGRRGEIEPQIVIGEPAGGEHRQRRRVAGAQHQPDLDDREREGEHRIDRQADLRIDLRQDNLEPGDGAAVAHRPRRGERGSDRHLAGGAGDHQHEIGDLLEEEAGDEGEAERVLYGDEGRRLVPAGEPGRKQTHDPAARRQEEGEADRGRGMGRREKRRQELLQAMEARPALRQR